MTNEEKAELLLEAAWGLAVLMTPEERAERLSIEKKAAFLAERVMGWELETKECECALGWEDVTHWRGAHLPAQLGLLRPQYWRPHKNRDQLAEVLAALTEEQRDKYMERLTDHISGQLGPLPGPSEYECELEWGIHTAAPAVCVDALIESLGGTP